MEEQTFFGYNDDVLRRRLRTSASYQRRSVDPPKRQAHNVLSDVVNARPPKAEVKTIARTVPSEPTSTSSFSKLQPNPVSPQESLTVPKATFIASIASTKPTEKKTKKSVFKFKKLYRNKTSLAILVLAGILFVTGMTVSWSALRTNHAVTSQVSALSKPDDGGLSGNDVPSESDPPKNSLSSYHVAADLPRYIRIPSIGVEARILRLSVADNNQLKAPSNIFDSGWYDGSAKPGEPGAMLIDGHVSGPTKHGIFYNIRNLKYGDDIQVERGNGKVYYYKVIRSQSYSVDQVDMTAALTPVTTGKNGLNLMTCSGKYDSKSKEYTQRLVVFAEEQGSK